MAYVRLKDFTDCELSYVSVEHEGVECFLMGLPYQDFCGQEVEVIGIYEGEEGCYFCWLDGYEVFIHESCVAEWVG